MSTLYNERKINKSRKEYKCNTCESIIPKGRSYVRTFNVDGRDVSDDKYCLICFGIIKQEVSTGEYEDGINTEQLLWDIEPDEKYFEMLQTIPNKGRSLEKLLTRWAEALAKEAK